MWRGGMHFYSVVVSPRKRALSGAGQQSATDTACSGPPHSEISVPHRPRGQLGCNGVSGRRVVGVEFDRLRRAAGLDGGRPPPLL